MLVLAMSYTNDKHIFSFCNHNTGIVKGTSLEKHTLNLPV